MTHVPWRLLIALVPLMADVCQGTDRLHKSMTAYIKAISKRSEGEDKEKSLPIAHLGSCMVNHGEDFDTNSEYGQCLTCKH
jgi:hypothetical protein